ncbi:T9SS type A sorting domain-containing protein [Balneolales bacterium ANBcel1]|nr:T9SS type A sorting domain-containing protein [Balneolales bacterium ANBcel1]
MVADLSIDTYSGDITISSGELDETVSLSGEVLEPIFLVYHFTGESVQPNQEPQNATTSDFQISSGNISFGTAGTWSGSGTPYAQGSGGWSVENKEDAKYFYFDINADETFAFDLSNISFEWRTTGAGPSAITVEINGQEVATFDSGSNAQDQFSESLTGFTNLTDVEVRVKGWDNGSRSTSGGGDFRINDVRIDGETVTYVEPALDDPVFDLAAGTYFENQTVFVDNYEDYESSVSVFYTLDGEDPDSESDEYDHSEGILLADGNGPITLKAIAIDGAETTNVTTAEYIFPINVADIAALRSQTADGSTLLRLNNEATFTAGTDFRNTKFFQDNSGYGIQIDDIGEVISTSYNAGDNVAELVGTLGVFQEQLQLVPALDPGAPVSTENIVTPVIRTLDNLTSDDQSRLVLVATVEFEDDGDAFGGGGFTTDITDPSIEGFNGLFRNVFGESDITGSTIPSVPVNITGVIQENNNGLNLAPRSLADIQPAEKTLTLTGTTGFRMLSTPVEVNLADFLSGIWTQGADDADAPNSSPTVFLWDNTATDGGDGNWNAVTNLGNTTVSAGTGFLVYVYEDDDPTEEGVTGGFPKTLSVTGIENQASVEPTINSNTDGFTLLGNPFAETVAFDDLDMENFTGVAYVWDVNDETGVDATGETDPGAGSWKTWSGPGNGGELTNGHIAPFQGFFVQNNDTEAGTVTFTEAAKQGNTDGFLGKQTSRDIVRLELEGSGMRNSTWLSFREHGALERVYGDAQQLAPLSADFAILATEKAGSLFDISILPEPEESFEIPLRVQASRSGTYTITATDVDLAFQMPLMLENRRSGERIPIEQGMTYSFDIEVPAAKRPVEGPESLQPRPMTALAEADNAAGPDLYIVAGEPLNTDQPGEVPVALELAQNYPNPFNPVTIIGYALPENSDVRLAVYDLLGRQVATLVNERQSTGRYQVSFDASELSSGIYIYRLEAGSHTLTRRMTLVK